MYLSLCVCVSSVAHIENDCNMYKRLYTARQNHIVDLIAIAVRGSPKDVTNIHPYCQIGLIALMMFLVTSPTPLMLKDGQEVIILQRLCL